MGIMLIIVFAALGLLRRISPSRDERIESAFRRCQHPRAVSHPAFAHLV